MMPGGARSRPKVSVVIPFLNTEEYLDEAVLSIRSQSLADIEIIGIDDGSTDDSAAVLEQHAAEDERVRLVRLGTNRGLGAARNAGAEIARGEYLYYFDSDDRLRPEALLDLVSLADHHLADIVYFDAVPFYETDELERAQPGYKKYYRRKGSYSGVKSGAEMLAEMAGNDDWKPSACLQLFRTEWYGDEGLAFPEGAYHEDNPFTLRAALAAERCVYLAEPYFERRVRLGSIVTSAPSAKHVLGLFGACSTAIREAERRGISPASPVGTAIAFESGKLFDAARWKLQDLDESGRAAVVDGMSRTFIDREILMRAESVTALDVARGESAPLRSQLDEANRVIAEYRQQLWRRIARRLLAILRRRR